MGEEADKISAADAHKRVVQLRAEIASKREAIGSELDELRRRRELALFQGKRMAKTAGFGLAGLWIGGSMARALFEFFQGDDTPIKPASEPTHHSDPTKPALVSTIVLMAAKWAANEFVRVRLADARKRLKEKHNAYAPGNYDEGEYFNSAPI